MEELQEGEEKYRCLPNVQHRISAQAMLTDNFLGLEDVVMMNDFIKDD